MGVSLEEMVGLPSEKWRVYHGKNGGFMMGKIVSLSLEKWWVYDGKHGGRCSLIIITRGYLGKIVRE